MGKYHRLTEEEIRFFERETAGRSAAEFAVLFHSRFGTELSESKVYNIRIRYKIYKDPSQDAPVKGVARFKKGSTYTKKATATWTKPVGSEETRSGILYVKTAEPNVWKQKHVIVWEEKNGKLPEGHMVIFIDGNKLNMDIDNLLMISRAENLVMHTYKLFSADRELMETGKTFADLIMLINKRKREVSTRKKPRRTEDGTGGLAITEEEGA